MAALASASSFAVGAAMPLVVIALAPETSLIVFVSGTSLLFLALLGALAGEAECDVAETEVLLHHSRRGGQVDAVDKKDEVHQDQEAQEIPGGASVEGEQHVALSFLIPRSVADSGRSRSPKLSVECLC